MSVPTAIVTAL